MSEARAKPQRQRPTLDDVLRTLRVHLPELREHYGVRTLGVFGSYVRGEQRPRSDLDLLVEFDQAPTLPDFIDLEHYLGSLLADDRTSFAVVRALEIIGEATKHIPHQSGTDIRKLPGRAWLECETS